MLPASQAAQACCRAINNTTSNPGGARTEVSLLGFRPHDQRNFESISSLHSPLPANQTNNNKNKAAVPVPNLKTPIALSSVDLKERSAYI